VGYGCEKGCRFGGGDRSFGLGVGGECAEVGVVEALNINFFMSKVKKGESVKRKDKRKIPLRGARNDASS
jgi:hypothetical protein